MSLSDVLAPDSAKTEAAAAAGAGPRLERRPPLDHTQSHLTRKPSKLQQMLSSAQAEIHAVKAESEKTSWRAAALHVIHSNWVQKTLIALLFIDIIALVIELLLDTEFPRCAVIQRGAICVANSTLTEEEAMTASFMANTAAPASNNMHVRRSTDGEEAIPHAVDGAVVFCLHHPDAVHGGHLALTVLSLIILSLFMIELLVLMACLGVKRFFKHILYDIDLFIVSISLALEITVIIGVDSRLDREVEAIVALLLLARMWRFARIIHSVFLETYDFEHERSRECRLELVHMKHKVAILEAQIECMHKDALDHTESDE
jgi:hypothetical protein